MSPVSVNYASRHSSCFFICGIVCASLQHLAALLGEWAESRWLPADTIASGHYESSPVCCWEKVRGGDCLGLFLEFSSSNHVSITKTCTKLDAVSCLLYPHRFHHEICAAFKDLAQCGCHIQFTPSCLLLTLQSHVQQNHFQVIEMHHNGFYCSALEQMALCWFQHVRHLLRSMVSRAVW